jgi:hypothetical protein
VNKREQKLLELYRGLPRDVADQLLTFAEFLAQRNTQTETIPMAPLEIPRPDEETVIGAVKRLSRTYPMLNKDAMLHETSGLVAQHLLHGRPATEVIDELESMFRHQYETLHITKDHDDYA